MKRTRTLAIAVFIALATCQVTFAAPSTPKLNPKQSSFVSFLLPKIEQANQKVENQRNQVVKLNQRVMAHQTLSRRDQKWLTQLAKSYKVTQPDFSSPQTWQHLLSRVDTLPPSLILAQAANESAWGTSRFAKQGNNYFGQWCYQRGCGLVPLRRNPGSTHEVKRFKDAYFSVSSYLLNLNSSKPYRTLRKLRHQQRDKKRNLNSVQLAEGLISYSQRGQAYVSTIQKMINRFGLQSFDISKRPQVAKTKQMGWVGRLKSLL